MTFAEPPSDPEDHRMEVGEPVMTGVEIEPSPPPAAPRAGGPEPGAGTERPGGTEPSGGAEPSGGIQPSGGATPANVTPSGDDEGPALGELAEAALEALLFVAERPLSRREIASAAGVDRETVDARLGDLEVSLRDRGIRLVLDGERVELVTAPEAGPLIARYLGADSIRLSPAALETLAIVAYRQPVTRAVVERIRGVDSDYTMRSLLHRRLIVELGRSEAPGRPFLYGTGFDFLERFGLTSLEELPPLDVEVASRLVEETEESTEAMASPSVSAADPHPPADADPPGDLRTTGASGDG